MRGVNELASDVGRGTLFVGEADYGVGDAVLRQGISSRLAGIVGKLLDALGETAPLAQRTAVVDEVVRHRLVETVVLLAVEEVREQVLRLADTLVAIRLRGSGSSEGDRDQSESSGGSTHDGGCLRMTERSEGKSAMSFEGELEKSVV